MGAVIHFGNPTRPLSKLRQDGPVIDVSQVDRPTAAKKGGDDAVIDTYLDHRGIKGYDRREAETVWALFKTLTNSKPLKDCDRNDGRLLVKRFQDDGNKRATIVKKVGWLRAAVQLAIDEDKEGKLKFNPFSNVVPEGADELERKPLDESDMKVCRAKLDKLDDAYALLFRILATTGMRLSEAHQIDGELKEKGVRYVVVGEKTETSKRRVPLPSSLLPHLPSRITGHLFGADTRAAHRLASKRLNRFLRNDCGITDPRKVIHSLRHRAADRLRAANTPKDIRYALLGHEKITAEEYGEGYPVPMLRKWIDKINGI
jgi:integrase